MTGSGSTFSAAYAGDALEGARKAKAPIVQWLLPASAVPCVLRHPEGDTQGDSGAFPVVLSRYAISVGKLNGMFIYRRGRACFVHQVVQRMRVVDGGVLKSVSKMPEQRSRFWLVLVIIIVCGIPGLAHAIPHTDFRYVVTSENVVYFNGSLSSDPEGIARCSWNFGDGTPEISSPVPTAYHLYSARGTYSVTLQVTNKASPPETGTITKPVEVQWGVVCTPPICEPPGTSTCAPGDYADCPGGCGTQCSSGTPLPYTDFTYQFLGANVVRYDGSLSLSPEGIASFSWNFGDGTPWTSSTVPLITHSYSADGTYWVSLQVTNKASPPQSFTITKEVTVYWFVCTAPACTPPGVLTCPTNDCPGGCGVECENKTPLGIGPVVAALAGVVMLHLRRRGE